MQQASDGSGKAMNLLHRHREILADKQAEFRRTRDKISNQRKSQQLLSSVRKDITYVPQSLLRTRALPAPQSPLRTRAHARLHRQCLRDRTAGAMPWQYASRKRRDDAVDA